MHIFIILCSVKNIFIFKSCSLSLYLITIRKAYLENVTILTFSEKVTVNGLIEVSFSKGDEAHLAASLSVKVSSPDVPSTAEQNINISTACILVSLATTEKFFAYISFIYQKDNTLPEVRVCVINICCVLKCDIFYGGDESKLP